MSEESAPVAVAPAAEPTPQATPPAVPQAQEVAPQEKLSSKLFKMLTATTEDPTEPKVEKKPEPAPAAKETKEAAPAKEAPADKPIKVRKPKASEEVPPTVPKKSDLKPATDPVAPVAAKPAVDDDVALEKDLVDEEKALLEDARAAEKYLGEKYKGQAAKMTNFLRETRKKEEALEKGDIDQAEYDEWYKANLPKISALDFRKLERERVKEDVAKEFEPKIEAERHARWAEAEDPKIKAKGDQLYNKVIKSALPEEVSKAIAERTKGITDQSEYIKAVQAVEKDYALETEITQNIVTAAIGDMEEFLRLRTLNPSTGKYLKPVDPNNPQHDRIAQIVTDVCNEFRAAGGSDIKRDGKWFVTWQEWQDMAPEQRKPFWTFNDEEIVQRAMGNVPKYVAQAVTTQREAIEKRYGFKRTIAQAAAPTTPAPQPTHGAPPAPRPTPVPPPPGTAAPSPGSILAAKLTTQPQEA